MINLLFDNFYYKLAFALILCLLLAFANSIDVLKKVGMSIIILIIIILILLSGNKDYNILLLLIGLFILSYNNVMFRQNDKDMPIKRES
jgi:hypothetical protein